MSGSDYLPETLSKSYSSSLLDHAYPFYRFKSSSLSSSPSDPCLYKSASLSKLNARAPEFIPHISISSAAAPSSSPCLLSPSISSPSLSSLSSSCGNLLSLVQSEQQSDLAATFVVPHPPRVPSWLHHVFNSNRAQGFALKNAKSQRLDYTRSRQWVCDQWQGPMVTSTIHQMVRSSKGLREEKLSGKKKQKNKNTHRDRGFLKLYKLVPSALPGAFIFQSHIFIRPGSFSVNFDSYPAKQTSHKDISDF